MGNPPEAAKTVVPRLCALGQSSFRAHFASAMRECQGASSPLRRAAKFRLSAHISFVAGVNRQHQPAAFDGETQPIARVVPKLAFVE